MTRYENLMDLNVVERTTRMMRVVDRRGYHLRWIEVPDEKTAALRENTAAEKDDSKSDGG